MAKKNNKKTPEELYGEMYERQLKQFESMDKEGGAPVGEELHFYTEEELAAQERARQTTAAPPQARPASAQRKASGQRPTSGQRQQRPPHPNDGSPRGVGQHPDARQRRRRAANPSAPEKYERKAREQAREHRGNEPVQFGANNSFKGKKTTVGSVIGGIFRWLLTIVLILLLIMQLLIFRYISLVNTVKTEKRTVTNASLSAAEVTNVLLIGSDTRDEEELGRTDSMILLSINRKSDEVTMTSLMRDSYVEIPDHGWDKLNAAYRYGGPELLMDTIAKNFDVKVDRYVYISFFSFINIVDAVGGIELDISDEEALGMTDPMAEQNKYLGYKKGTDYLTHGGKDMHVNGNQALAYARLRYVGNADFERTDRQRRVISKIVAKAKTLKPLQLDSFLKVSCGELTTNMSKAELYIMFYKLLFSMRYDINELRIPPEGAYYAGSHDGQSTLDLDLSACTQAIAETVYKK
ncbi:transcriptional attenuator, LytR family [Ruminococcus sp. YE71]|uniref:LCP family protein n=1 Tax=unclassified Ruminococcus TaxID=2608920 RepID=UPI0008856BB5|nr:MULTISPECIES: LCP family protein [unclassified Ruminococcus]SDA27194.1 transcriptional attenuator, LytR family [Ruminococcus sp. YE78]SFW45419.1 transcriptional attenuator, LytR family [Ruminococcus sp. YE71]